MAETTIHLDDNKDKVAIKPKSDDGDQNQFKITFYTKGNRLFLLECSSDLKIAFERAETLIEKIIRKIKKKLGIETKVGKIIFITDKNEDK